MENTEKLLRSYLPMSEASFLVLQSLDQPLHGYGIMQKVAELTGGRVALGGGTVYTILSKMETDGLIEAAGETERRKQYQITETGRKILFQEQERILQLYDIISQTRQNHAALSWIER